MLSKETYDTSEIKDIKRRLIRDGVKEYKI